MKISGTNKELVEIINLLDPSFKCKCNPNANRFRCDSTHDQDCLFEAELPKEYEITVVRSYNVEYDGNKIINVSHIETLNHNGNILSGTVR
jgi:hypothetical protein